MKKLLALCLAACLSLSVFTSCGDGTSTTTTTSPDSPIAVQKSYIVKDGVLVSCIGQADENGVYVVPTEVSAIAESAFAGDVTLKEIVIGSHVNMIGSGAFQNCTSLTKVTIEEGVTDLGSHVFYGCTALASVSLPQSVETIKPYAFYGCVSLETIDLSYVRVIETGAFWCCSALERVRFSEDRLREIGSWAFAQNTSLSETNLAELTALRSIGDYAFQNCTMLLSVSVPEGVETIGKLAFYECTRLSDVKISSTVKTVDYAAFNFTPWYQENDDDYLVVGDGVLIKVTAHPNDIDLSDENIKVIGATAFWNAASEGQAVEYGYKYASSLETLVIPDTVTVIGNSAFAGCYNLKQVVLPAGITEIGTAAFNVYAENSETATNVDFTNCNNLQTIGAYAFHGCYGITSAELPASVTEVGTYAFAATSAYDAFMAEASKKENEADRYFITGDGMLLMAYVADGQTKITVPNGVKRLAGGVFCGWDIGYIPEDMTGLSNSGVSKYNISYKIKELSLPETLLSIGEGAFFRMLSVTDVLLPDSLKEIGSDAFAFCDALTNLSYGADTALERIGAAAFRYCTKIPGFILPDTVTEIGEGVFVGCTSLANVYLPKGLENPGSELFGSECTSLRTLTVNPAARSRIYSILGSATQLGVKVYYYENDGARAVSAGEALTLDALKVLAQQHGKALSWEHFTPYYTSGDVGSGLYIRHYPVGEDFYVLIGGADSISEPLYVYLSLKADRDRRIDVRTESIDAFLSEILS